MQRNFWKLFVNSLHDYDVEFPHFAPETHDDLISFLFLSFFFSFLIYTPVRSQRVHLLTQFAF